MRKIIQIMKASAGSGKTFNLARKYITLLFRKKERYPYRHIGTVCPLDRPFVIRLPEVVHA